LKNHYFQGKTISYPNFLDEIFQDVKNIKSNQLLWSCSNPHSTSEKPENNSISRFVSQNQSNS
jgi:hypothetical protein